MPLFDEKRKREIKEGLKKGKKIPPRRHAIPNPPANNEPMTSSLHDELLGDDDVELIDDRPTAKRIKLPPPLPKPQTPPPQPQAPRLHDADSLVEAAKDGDFDTVEEALGQGLDVDSRNSKGQTALQAAASAGRYAIVAVLLTENANPSSKDGSGKDVMMLAAAKGSTKIMEMLKEAGASVVSRDPNNRSALYYAVDGGNLEACEWLLQNGANPNAKDSTGLSLLGYARRNGLDDIEALLKKHGAKK